MIFQLNLPSRPPKPRPIGTSCLIDDGLPTSYFRDVIESHGDLIDNVKFGWGTSLVTREIQEKIKILASHQIPFFFGGTLFEKAYQCDRVDEYLAFCRESGCEIIEVSNGTLSFSLDEKCDLIRRISCDFAVWSEVGFKDPQQSLDFPPSRWIESIEAELDAGSTRVIIEARESGTSGICRRDGEVRYGLIEDILTSGVDVDKLVFEAPNKELQTYFILKLGPNVNLANIHFSEIVGTETLRLGLCHDTFYL
jgi:phosphosulfolactate synthase